MNVADSEYFAQILDEFGFSKAESPAGSDLVLVNTCVVRAKAEDKAVSYLGELERIRRAKGNLKVIVAGCISPLSDRLELKRRFPSILFTINPTDIFSFRELLAESIETIDFTQTTSEIACDKTSSDKDISDSDKIPFHAFVNVMRGCEQFCTYCVVPETRGSNVSRRFEDIAAEIEKRITQGTKVITLLGQSILDYGKDWVEGKSIRSIRGDDQFRNLLERISDLFPDLWIKFLTSHPKDFSHDLVNLISSRPNISRYIHLPIQSGDNGILKRMGRGHDRNYYLDLVGYIQKTIPDVRLSSDIIVGFPGESADAFEQSLDLLRKIRFFKVFTFQYSPRPATSAALFKDDLTFEEKRARLNRLIDLQNHITIERHEELVGQEMDVMIEGTAKKTDHMLMGRSLNEDIVIFNKTDDLVIGDLVRLRIVEALQRSLVGELVTEL